MNLLRRVVILLTLPWLALLGASPAGAQREAGQLDPTFGHGGIVVTALPGHWWAGALQGDGKVVAGGAVARFDRLPHFVLARYSEDGTLDRMFGGDGVVETRFGALSSRAFGVAIQADGRVVLAGNAFSLEGQDNRFALARYLPSGALDRTFGDAGRVLTVFPAGPSFAQDVAVQPDGRIVAAGSVFTGFQGVQFALARYLPDGTLDAGFGEGGLVETGFPGGESSGHALAIQPDGRIVVAGIADPLRFALARYLPDGTLDPSFGSGGKVFADLPGDAEGANDLTIQPDGRIVVVGGGDPPGEETSAFAVARYTADGRLDPTFSLNGSEFTVFPVNGDDGAGSVGMDSNGNIVSAGIAGYDPVERTGDWALARYTPDGRLDQAFGEGGLVVTSLGKLNEFPSDLLIQPDDRIVCIGGASGNLSGTRRGPALARYLA